MQVFFKFTDVPVKCLPAIAEIVKKYEYIRMSTTGIDARQPQGQQDVTVRGNVSDANRILSSKSENGRFYTVEIRSKLEEGRTTEAICGFNRFTMKQSRKMLLELFDALAILPESDEMTPERQLPPTA
ncbi:MAG: hypothetical protein FJY91_03195 [Candidatus Harrisonbacteria bacterium]|nr:hypothetical protein [Candidatus Harrisonbacteria bacterium]